MDPASEADRECVTSAGAGEGPNGEADDAEVRLIFCLDDFLCSPGRGAVIGGGEAVKPTVFMSSGWKSPRRTEFFIYFGLVRINYDIMIGFLNNLKVCDFLL